MRNYESKIFIENSKKTLLHAFLIDAKLNYEINNNSNNEK